MRKPATSDIDADRGEQILVVFLESGDAGVVGTSTETLRARGFDVHVASADGHGPTVVFDYAAARYLVVAVTGGSGAMDDPTSPPAYRPSRGPGPDSRATGTKVLVFPGAPIPEASPGTLYVPWDPDGAWVELIVDTIRRLRAT